MTTKNLVVATSRDVAENYAEAFGLINGMASDWDCRAHHESDQAGIYDRIVVIRQHWGLSADDVVQFEQWVSNWSGHVKPGGKFLVL